MESADSTPGGVTVHDPSRLSGVDDAELEDARDRAEDRSRASEPVEPRPSPRRQLAIMVAFLAASAALIAFVGGVDAVQHAAAHLFPNVGGCGGG